MCPYSTLIPTTLVSPATSSASVTIIKLAFKPFSLVPQLSSAPTTSSCFQGHPPWVGRREESNPRHTVNVS